MEIVRQEYWSGLTFSSPGNLPNPGIELTSLAPPALAGRFFTTVPWEIHINNRMCQKGGKITGDYDLRASE